MATVVFTGPSLPAAEVRSLLPRARVRPPIQRGDLLRERLGSGDVALVLDGYYFHRPALQHVEVLEALARGVTVVGAASLGALRAAELHREGMVGVGRIFEAYRDGRIVGDDEVAVLHDEELMRPSTLPLVSVRATLSAAVAAGRCSRDAAAWVVGDLRRRWFGERTRACVRRAIAGSPHAAEAAGVLDALDHHFVDLKGDDARSAVSQLATAARSTREPPAPTVFREVLVRHTAEDRDQADLVSAWCIVDRDAHVLCRLAGCVEVLRVLRPEWLASAPGCWTDPARARSLPALVLRALVEQGHLAADASEGSIDAFVCPAQITPGLRLGGVLRGRLVARGDLDELAAAAATSDAEPPVAIARLCEPVMHLWQCDRAALDRHARARGLAGLAELLVVLRRPAVWRAVVHQCSRAAPRRVEPQAMSTAEESRR